MHVRVLIHFIYIQIRIFRQKNARILFHIYITENGQGGHPKLRHFAVLLYTRLDLYMWCWDDDHAWKSSNGCAAPRGPQDDDGTPYDLARPSITVTELHHIDHRMAIFQQTV